MQLFVVLGYVTRVTTLWVLRVCGFLRSASGALLCIAGACVFVKRFFVIVSSSWGMRAKRTLVLFAEDARGKLEGAQR